MAEYTYKVELVFDLNKSTVDRQYIHIVAPNQGEAEKMARRQYPTAKIIKASR